MKYCLFILVILLSSPVFNQASAQQLPLNQNYDTQINVLELETDYSGVVKDSFYYMKDDGEFSDEEKDQEAMGIYQKCNSNAIQRIYYDCGCVAGKFRLERDSEKLVPQSQIISKIYNDKNSQCANTLGIAGDSYNKCTSYTKVFRERETPERNELYCQCVANQMATNFSEEPSLNLKRIRNLQTKSMLACNKQT